MTTAYGRESTERADARTARTGDDGAEEDEEESVAGQPVPDQFEVVVRYEDEADQKKFYDRMQKEKRPCRLLTV